MAQSLATPAYRAEKFDRRELEEQTDRILAYAKFRTSQLLQTFLRFIVAMAIECKEDCLTEQLIATEVFARAADFDCSADTVVRTHAYRLRQKLKEYYAGPGLADEILIEVPKGHYRARFSRREDELHFSVPQQLTEAGSAPARETGLHRGVIITCCAIVALSLGAGIWIGKESRFGERTASAAESSRALLEVDRFWDQFLGSDKSPIIAYSNDLYLSTEGGNLLMFSGPAADRGTLASPEAARLGVPGFELLRNTGPLYFEDDKTDVGEVVSASVLTAQLVRMGVHPTLKRGRVITTYDLESHNVIFVGSPFANKILKEIEGNANFVFRDEPRRPNLWGGAIRNLHPQGDESGSYFLERDANTGALKADYAVVTSLPGLLPSRKILVLGGLTTSGTQAAAQFVTSAAGMTAMLGRRHAHKKVQDEQWSSHFEYLLRVTLDRGLDLLRTECMADRRRADPEVVAH